MLPDNTPDGISALLRRRLLKNVAKRYHAAADLRIQIEDVRPTPVVQPVAAVGTPPAWQDLLPWGIAAISLAIASGSQFGA